VDSPVDAITIGEKLHASQAWRQIKEDFLSSGDAAPVLARLTSAIEKIALQAYASSLAPVFPQGLAMLAVGGFGRRDLFPYSDIDIMLLVQNDSMAADLKEPLSEFVRLLWDMGLRLSHSVRTVAECTEIHEENIQLNVSLLDRRLLAGDESLYSNLEAKFPQFLERRARQLSQHLCHLSVARHGKFQDTIYHLAPDIKETPGGLRDIHLLGWLTKLKRADADVVARLAEPHRFFSALRCFLHYQAGRDQNLLDFEAQHEIARQTVNNFREPAAYMREYFRNARLVCREARRAIDLVGKNETSLLTQFRSWRSRLSNSDFTVSNDRVLLRQPSQLENDPDIVLRLFQFIARHGIPLATETERRLERSRKTLAVYWAGQHNLWTPLRNILSLPHAAKALRAMNDADLLQALFPEWNQIVCLVVPDFYHRYTVDEHTLVGLEKLAEVSSVQEGPLRPFAEILSEIENLALLRFALLFHDTGKGSNSGDHSRASVEQARQVMQRIQMPADDQAAVEFLIEHHLVLSTVMNSRDLHDPATAHMLADRIGTIEQLKRLTVLTYADISAVHPGAMTPWRLEQLAQTYRIAHQELLHELETDRIVETPESLAGLDTFIKGFPVRYLRTHSVDEIRAHSQLKELSRPMGVAVEIDRQGTMYRLTIVARDTPFLFASLSGAISSFGLDIVKAEAFSNAKGLILDTFVFADPHRTLDLNPSELKRLQQTIEQVALGKVDVQRLLVGRPKRAKNKRPNIKSRVYFDSEACETATLAEIIAEDRPGLLYSLASTFSSAGCNIDVVLIDTEGYKAIDVFYVASDGKKLTPELTKALEKRLLEAC
jgi:[protein-PII] uridylyltransferase